MTLGQVGARLPFTAAELANDDCESVTLIEVGIDLFHYKHFIAGPLVTEQVWLELM